MTNKKKSLLKGFQYRKRPYRAVLNNRFNWFFKCDFARGWRLVRTLLSVSCHQMVFICVILTDAMLGRSGTGFKWRRTRLTAVINAVLVHFNSDWGIYFQLKLNHSMYWFWCCFRCKEKVFFVCFFLHARRVKSTFAWIRPK